MDAREIIAWRERLGWSLTQAAEALGVERRTYVRYEASDRPIARPIEKLCRLIELYGTGIAAIGEAQAAKRSRADSGR